VCKKKLKLPSGYPFNIPSTIYFDTWLALDKPTPPAYQGSGRVKLTSNDNFNWAGSASWLVFNGTLLFGVRADANWQRLSDLITFQMSCHLTEEIVGGAQWNFSDLPTHWTPAEPIGYDSGLLPADSILSGLAQILARP